jgi:pyruvate/2-oxoglutarate dehydrogenase complex dihydrolipoamide dehydrogenase (E3) component
MGNGHFVAQKTLEVSVHGAGTRTFTADKIILHAGLLCRLAHIEALELDY